MQLSTCLVGVMGIVVQKAYCFTSCCSRGDNQKCIITCRHMEMKTALFKDLGVALTYLDYVSKALIMLDD